MFRYRIAAVGGNIADHRTVAAGRFDINVVVTGCRHRNQFELRIGRQMAAVDEHFVGNHHIGTGQPLGGFLRRSTRIFD